MREYKSGSVAALGCLLALALVILACALPVYADTLPASQLVAPDRLFDQSLSVTSGGIAPSSTDLDLRAPAGEDGSAFSLLAETDTLDLLAGRRDNRTETGAPGVRRFLLLTLIFGAALRYLTSPTFYRWASDVFDPLDGY